MPPGELHYLTISELMPLLRRREVSPVDLVEEFLGRIARLDGKMRAYITVTADQARADARAAETALAGGTDLGPLHGIPVALKDLCDTAGIRTTSGSKILAQYVPSKSSTVAKRLTRSGAVLLGKANTVEFAFEPYGRNPHYGTPLNLYDRERAPGGSSSGSAVAVAAGLATVAIGTDTGGSVRIPASYCGIVGLKPTAGRVSTSGITPLSWTLDSVGSMARSVEDAALLYEAISGPDPDDPSTLNLPADLSPEVRRSDVRGARVGVVRQPFFSSADPDVATAAEQAVAVLSNLGVQVEEMDFPEARAVVDGGEGLLIMKAEGYAYHRERLKNHADAFDPRIRRRFEEGAAITAADYIHALQLRTCLMRSALERLRTVDAVVGPTMPAPAPRIADIRDDQAVRLTTRVANVLGLCAISIPCGFTSEGLPVGLQLIGRPFDEGAILRLAIAYERSTEWHLHRPPGCA